jgi:endonuclease/exonuclease/phosphatase (EEP) superfamily protein YafD
VKRPSGTAVSIVVLWLLLLATGLFAALRAIGLEDDSGRFFALVTLTPVLLLPAYVVVVGGLVMRRWLLVAAALLVVGAHVAWTAPDLRWWRIDQPRTEGDAFTVAAANVRFDNDRVDDVTGALRSMDADVLVVTELGPRLADALQGERPHVAADPRPGAFGSGVYSRFPLSGERRFDLEGFPALQVDVAAPGGTLTLVAVHTLQPLSDIDVLRRQLRALDRLRASLRREGRQVVLAGDFNATAQHRGFRRLLDHGLRDAHRERGRGRVRTWPADRWHPPFAALDHVLVSGGIAVEDAGTVGIPGSDHRAVTATLTLG